MKIIRSILFILNVLLAFGLVLTSIAGAIAPSQSIYPSILAFGFPLLLGANVVMVVLWLLWGRWEFLLSTVCILARITVVPLFLQVGGAKEVAEKEASEGVFSVMTYNVHNFLGHDLEPTNMDSNAREFVELVREQGPEVLCLQEFLPGRKVSVTDSLELMGYNHFYSTAGAQTGHPRGVVVFSKVPITYVKTIDKTKLLVELMMADQRVRVCCVHMSSYQFDSVDRQEIERLRHGEVEKSTRRTFSKIKHNILEHEREWNEKLLPIVEACSVPIIVAGDMNDIPSSYLYHQATRQLRDAFCEKGSGFGATYDGGFPRFRIDMVFHSDEMDALAYRRLKTKISDHYPVMVTFKLNPQKETR